MLKFLPKYNNFKYLNGELDSFEEDNYSVFVLMPFGDEETRDELTSIYNTIKETAEKGCFHGGILKCNRADMETDLIMM